MNRLSRIYLALSLLLVAAVASGYVIKETKLDEDFALWINDGGVAKKALNITGSTGAVTLGASGETATHTVNGGLSVTGTVALTTTPLAVSSGGTGRTSGTSGGIIYYSASNATQSSGALTAGRVVLGGGAGASPTSLSFGTANQLLGMNSGATAYEHKSLVLGSTAQSNNLGIVNAANSITIHVPDASATVRGVITTGSQTIAGAKTFSSPIATSGGSDITASGDLNASRTIATTKVFGGSGTAASPTFAFHDDVNDDTGSWRPAENQIGFAVAGTNVATVTTGGFSVSGDINASDDVSAEDSFFASLGAVGSPSYSITGDPDTGMWSSAANTLNFSTSGVSRLAISSGGTVSTTGSMSVGDSITQAGTGGDTPHDCHIDAGSGCGFSNGQTVAPCDNSCDGGASEIVMGGGCVYSGSNALVDNFPLNANTWRCDYTGTSSGSTSVFVYAICCKL